MEGTMTPKDFDLLNFLIGATKDGKVHWEPTAAREEEFTTSFKGKYKVSLYRGGSWRQDLDYIDRLRLTNDSDQELTKMTSEDSVLVSELFELVRRQTLRVDDAIDEIIGF